MLAVEPKDVTIFELPRQDKNGKWRLVVTRNGSLVKGGIFSSWEKAQETRDRWIERFWTPQLN